MPVGDKLREEMSSIKQQIKQQFTSELSRSSPETVRTRLFWCDSFLEFAPNDFSQWDKDLVNRFISHLEKKYGVLTVRTAFGVVKRVFDAAKLVHERERLRVNSEIREKRKAVDLNDPQAAAILMSLQMDVDDVNALRGPQWDVGKRAMPRVQSISKPPAFSLEEVKAIVAEAKKGDLQPQEVAFTALASIYGLRLGELQAVRPEDIDYSGGMIFVRTEKGGERRNQMLAPEIIPWLRQYDFHWEFSDSWMNKMFKKIINRAGIEETDGAWHRFRHFLDGVLRDALASDPDVRKDYEMIVRVYFRWALSRSSDMSVRYYPEHPLEADQICLAHNPIVPLWG